MENQSLITSPNDNVEKQKKGSAPTFYYVAVSTAILLLGLLVFYANSDVIPAASPPPPGSDACVVGADDCVIPAGLTHGVCIDTGGPAVPQAGVVTPRSSSHHGGTCQSGQPGAWCEVTDDCVVQTGLTPPHAVCRHGKCQR